mmetsp:Transcript_123284/g.299498  ORF Transcript_123284/g.299498 Transcript_123284/m.299498 type:complete len:236 (-) Transcript_123284:80-787(-)
MRTAWKVSFSGRWLRSSRPRLTLATDSRSSSEFSKGPCWACQPRRASARRAASSGSLSSPYSRRIQASSLTSSPSSALPAGTPCPGFMRMSRRPAVKPRAGSSSWGEETPRSMSTPESSTSGGTASARSPKGLCRIWKRGSWRSSCRATSTASGSTSKAKSRPFSESLASRAAEWPPLPKVQSTYTPSIASPTAGMAASTVGLQSAGTWPARGPQMRRRSPEGRCSRPSVPASTQ